MNIDIGRCFLHLKDTPDGTKIHWDSVAEAIAQESEHFQDWVCNWHSKYMAENWVPLPLATGYWMSEALREDENAQELLMLLSIFFIEMRTESEEMFIPNEEAIKAINIKSFIHLQQQ